jgi:hypothetical protein
LSDNERIDQVLSLNMEEVASSKARISELMSPAVAVAAPGQLTTGPSEAALPGESPAAQDLPLPVSTDLSIPEDALQQFPQCNTSEGTSSSPIDKPDGEADAGNKDPSSLETVTAPETLQYATLRSSLRMAVTRQNSRRKLRDAEKAARRREKRAEEAQQQAAAQQISCLQVSS